MRRACAPSPLLTRSLAHSGAGSHCGGGASPRAPTVGGLRASIRPKLVVTRGSRSGELWERVANPPLTAILVGVTIGLTPFACDLSPPEGVGATDALDSLTSAVSDKLERESKDGRD